MIPARCPVFSSSWVVARLFAENIEEPFREKSTARSVAAGLLAGFGGGGDVPALGREIQSLVIRLDLVSTCIGWRSDVFRLKIVATIAQDKQESWVMRLEFVEYSPQR